MPRQDEPLAGEAQSIRRSSKRLHDDSHTREPKEAPDKGPARPGDLGADDDPFPDDLDDGQITNDLPEKSPADDSTNDPDSTADTVLTPGSPSEYDRQRDALPNRGSDNWTTATSGR